MDVVVLRALEEICTQGARGLSLSSLWLKISPTLSSNSLPLCHAVKTAFWTNLLDVPGLRFEAANNNKIIINPKNTCMEECERVGVRIFANDRLLDNFVGIFDHTKAFKTEIPPNQRRVLERLALARTNGIPQSELAKEFGIQGNKLHYLLESLEKRGLIVRYPTVLRVVDASCEKKPKTISTVTTNMMYLHRYAKHLSSHQRLEVTKYVRTPLIDKIAIRNFVDEDDIDGDCGKYEVHLKDDMPALKAICDKLELADGKVLVVADIKRDLGYISSSRHHKAWTYILKRLKDAHLVEDFDVAMNKKEVPCLRLLKSFSPKNFKHRAIQKDDDNDDDDDNNNDNDDDDDDHDGVDHLGKRSQITDQLMELPIEHQIYDMIDAEGSKGLTKHKVCKRLGLNQKRYDTRLHSMSSRFGMQEKEELHKKVKCYRFWTPGNFNHEAYFSFSNKSKKVLNSNCTSSSSDRDAVVNEMSAQKQPGLDVWTTEIAVGDSDKLQKNVTEPELSRGSPTDRICVESSGNVSKVASLESCAVALSTPRRKQKSDRQYLSLRLTAACARREQWILQMLQDKKFIIGSDLHRELISFEKDKQTMTDKKTLDRALNKLQQEGHCKCITVSSPLVTNCGRSRTNNVILQASINVTPELLVQIYERLRSFNMEIRDQGLSKLKKDESVHTLDGVQRLSKNAKLDGQAECSEAMRANGFVLAKMVRTKLLHIYLWSYLSSSPGWSDALPSAKLGYDLKNPHSTCKLFSVEAAIKSMPLDLFFQVVGSSYKFEGMNAKCRIGLRLSDLPNEEYQRVVNTRAMGRLSQIVDLLLRLKLLRLVSDGQSEDNVAGIAHATLNYAMEIKPYIEEPVSVIIESGNIPSFNLRPEIRHDFVLLRKEAIDTYWNTLEYSHSASDPRAASLAFPGSAVHEVFYFRSWTSTGVMTAGQRAKLRKRVEDNFPNKISFEECEKVAKDLNLTLEQVLRVYYNKRQQLPRFKEDLDVRREDLQAHKKQVPSSRKRKKSSGGRLSTTKDDYSKRKKPSESSDADYQSTEKHNFPSTSLGEHDDLLETSKYENHGDATEEPDSSKEREHHCLVQDCVLSRMKSKRNKRFSWTEKAERKLIVVYARERAALGAKFHRVHWLSLLDLPAPPQNCKRRMETLNSDETFRKAMMRLCNVLGEQYAKHLDQSQSKHKHSNSGDCNIIARNSVFIKGCSSGLSADIEDKADLRLEKQWYNFESENVKSALEDVLRLRTNKRLVSSRNRSTLDINAEDTIGGTMGSPFALLRQFLDSISSSLFPDNTGKRAAKFNRWICENEKDLIEQGRVIATDLKWGDVVHICALVFTGEFSISPCLPDEGVGEPENSRISKRKGDHNKLLSRDKAKKRKLSSSREGEISYRRKKGFPGISLLVSRARLSKLDVGDVLQDGHINNDIGEADQVNTYSNINTREPFSSFNLNHVEEILNGQSSFSKEIVGTESEWEGMTSYATRLRSSPANQQVNPFHPPLFKNLYSDIKKAGDQGLTMEDVTQMMNSQEKEVPELAVEALEAFGRVVKVNSYASVHVVDSLYRWKYFLTSKATFNQHVEVALTKDSKSGDDNDQPEQHENINLPPGRDEDDCTGIAKDVHPDNDGIHKITILNLPKEVSIFSSNVQHIESVEAGGQMNGTSTKGNFNVKNSEFHRGGFESCRPILPWVNDDGTINKIVYKGLLRGVLGILMKNPGMLEDNIVNQMSVFNPQSCRQLLKLMIMDNHIIVRKMNQRTSGEPPSILSSIFKSNFKRSKFVCRQHLFANPISTTSL